MIEDEQNVKVSNGEYFNDNSSKLTINLRLIWFELKIKISSFKGEEMLSLWNNLYLNIILKFI